MTGNLAELLNNSYNVVRIDCFKKLYAEKVIEKTGSYKRK